MRRASPQAAPFALPLVLALLACSGSIDGSEGDPGSSGAGSGGRRTGGASGAHGGGGATGGTGVIAPGVTIRNENLGLACPDKNAIVPGSSPIVRLTEAELNNTLADAFRGLATIPAQDLPGVTSVDGFDNNTSSQTASALLIESYESAANTVAALVVDKALGCTPASATDEGACVDKFLDTWGKRLYRRPLASDERDALETAFSNERKSDDFKTAMRTVMAGMLQSPQFLYRVEYGDTSKPTGAGSLPLTGYEMAARLSYVLWDTMPDDALFTAAAAGDLGSAEGVAKQIDRMIGDARAKAALGVFMTQWLDLDRIEQRLAKKDKTIFPKYTDATVAALKAGTRRFLDGVLWDKGANLQSMLSDNRAFVNTDSAWIYGATAPSGATLGAVTLDASKRGAGVLTQAGVLAGLGHETLHAPILRGIWVLDRLLCAPPPPPPANVMQLVPDAKPGETTTLRQRIETQHETGNCAGCHKYIDNVGFAFENYDAVGQYRTKEGAADVNPTGTLSGTYDLDGAIAGLADLAGKLQKSEQVAECTTVQWFRWAMQRSLEQPDGCAISQLTNGLVASKGDMRAMLTSLLTSDAFRTRSKPAN